MGSVTVAAIRGKLAADLLAEIGKADYIEGLADEIRELAEQHQDEDNPEINEVLKLYDWLEKARAEYIVLRSEINDVLEDQSEASDSAT